MMIRLYQKLIVAPRLDVITHAEINSGHTIHGPHREAARLPAASRKTVGPWNEDSRFEKIRVHAKGLGEDSVLGGDAVPAGCSAEGSAVGRVNDGSRNRAAAKNPKFVAHWT